MQCQPRRNPQDVDAVACSEIPPWRRPLPEKPLTAEATAVGMGDAIVRGAAGRSEGLPRTGYRKIIRLQPFSRRDQGSRLGMGRPAQGRSGRDPFNSLEHHPGDCRHKPGPRVARSGRVLLSLDRVCRAFLHEAQTRSLPGVVAGQLRRSPAS